MRMTPKAAIAALSLATATVLAAPTAEAATLLDFLRGTKSKKNEFAVPPDQDLGLDPALSAKPLPRVAAPKYYTYKPDKLRLVSVAGFAPGMDVAVNDVPVGAANDADVTGSVEPSRRPHWPIFRTTRAPT